MEWLINRRRMMCHESVPPAYLTFEDAEFWRRTCINYGDYIETVITNNGDNTVNIVRRFRSVIMNSNQTSVTTKKLEVLETQTNVDNSGGTYTAGTTKEPVGITQRQCDAITKLGYYSGGAGIINVYKGSSLITSANDYSKFRNLTEICGDWNGGRHGGVFGCTNVESAEIPNSLIAIGQGAFYNCSKLTSFDFKNVKTIQRAAFQGTALTSVILNEGFLAIKSPSSGGPFFNVSTIKYVDLPSTITTIESHNFNKTNISVLVCRATTVPTLGTYNTGPRAIYVPAAAIEDYKAAENWSAQASKIQAIEGTWYETHRELEPTT